MKKTQLSGYLQAVSELELTAHPLQTRLRLVLTPFTPNANKQGIPQAEAENFARTALNQPVKVNMTAYGIDGHDFAIPIGPIVSTSVEELDGEQVVIGEAVVWNDEFPDVAKFLKTAKSRVDTSWEVYFAESEIIDEVEWLHGVVFAGTCIVKNPAYRGKTPILAISEEQMEELKAQIADLEAKIAELTAAAENGRAEWESEKASLVATNDNLKQELQTYLDEKAAAETLAKENSRKEKLSVLELDDQAIAAYLQMPDELFDRVVSDLLAIASKQKSKSEDKTFPVPESLGGSNKQTPKELAQAYKNFRKK